MMCGLTTRGDLVSQARVEQKALVIMSNDVILTERQWAGHAHGDDAM